MFDPSSLPIGGLTLAACLLYAGASTFGSGPLVADRMIDKSAWGQMCPAMLEADLAAGAPRASSRPMLNCGELLGSAHDPSLRDMCETGGALLGALLAFDPKVQAAERASAERLRLFAHARANVGARCDCAASVVAGDRTSWGLYAGSARMIEPRPVQNLEASLKAALSSPACAMRGRS